MLHCSRQMSELKTSQPKEDNRSELGPDPDHEKLGECDDFWNATVEV